MRTEVTIFFYDFGVGKDFTNKTQLLVIKTIYWNILQLTIYVHEKTY